MSEPEDDELPFEEEVGEIADDCAGTILAELAESYGLDENDLRLYDLIIEPIRQAIRAVLDRVEKEEAQDMAEVQEAVKQKLFREVQKERDRWIGRTREAGPQ